MRIERVPAVVALRLREGWTTSRIARRYGLSVSKVRVWRWLLGVVSTDARPSLAAVADPDEVQRLAAEGVPLRHIARRLGAPAGPLYTACSEGAIVYEPRETASLRVAKRAARAKRRRQEADRRARRVRAMLAEGLTTGQAAKAVGLTPRRVRQIRAGVR